MTLHRRRMAFATAIALASAPLAAQDSTTAPVRSFGVGWSPAAGLIGIERVQRSFSFAPRLGGAVGFGIGGVGARANLMLRRRAQHRREPYLAAGYSVTAWLPVIDTGNIVSLETGVQFWPVGRRQLYFDLGAGVAFIGGRSDDVGPVLRLLFGRSF